MKKLILTGFMAFVLLLAACSSDNTDDSSETEQTPEEEPATETEPTEPEDTDEQEDSEPAGETEEEPTDAGDTNEEPAADTVTETPDETPEEDTDGTGDTEEPSDTEEDPSAEKVTAAFNGMSDTHSMEVKMEDGSLAVINFHEEDAEVINELQQGAKIKYTPVTEENGMEYATEIEVIE